MGRQGNLQRKICGMDRWKPSSWEQKGAVVSSQLEQTHRGPAQLQRAVARGSQRGDPPDTRKISH